jgi:hypothetical protein
MSDKALKFETSRRMMESLPKHTTPRHEAKKRMSKHSTMPLDLALTDLEAKKPLQASQAQLPLDTSFPFQMTTAERKRRLSELLDDALTKKKVCVVNSQRTSIVMLKEKFTLLRRTSHKVKLEQERHCLKRASIVALCDLNSWQTEYMDGELSQSENSVETHDPMTWDEVMVGLVQRQAPRQKSKLTCIEQLPPRGPAFVPLRFPEPYFASFQVNLGQHDGFVEMPSSGETKLCSVTPKTFTSSTEANLNTLSSTKPKHDDLRSKVVVPTDNFYSQPTAPT